MVRGKKIVVIRHAQSKAQTFTQSNRGNNLDLLDAPLSQMGQRQALEAVPPRDIDLIVCSPLTRTIQTACLVFRGTDFEHIPMIAHPDASEFAVKKAMAGHENTGRHFNDIATDERLLNLPRFKTIDFSLLSGYKEEHGTDWWIEGVDHARIHAKISRLKIWLEERPEKRIAIVGHCNALMKLLNTKFRIPNALPIYCVLNRPFTGGHVRVMRQDRPLASLLFIISCKSKKATLKKLRQIAPDDHTENQDSPNKFDRYAQIVNMVQETKRTKRAITEQDERMIVRGSMSQIGSPKTSPSSDGSNPNIPAFKEEQETPPPDDGKAAVEAA